MITYVRLAGGLDPRTIAMLSAAHPDYWDDIPFDTEPAIEIVDLVTVARTA